MILRRLVLVSWIELRVVSTTLLAVVNTRTCVDELLSGSVLSCSQRRLYGWQHWCKVVSCATNLGSRNFSPIMAPPSSELFVCVGCSHCLL